MRTKVLRILKASRNALGHLIQSYSASDYPPILVPADARGNPITNPDANESEIVYYLAVLTGPNVEERLFDPYDVERQR